MSDTYEEFNKNFQRVSIKKLKKLSFASSSKSPTATSMKQNKRLSLDNNTIESQEYRTHRSKLSLSSIPRISAIYTKRKKSIATLSSVSRKSTLIMEREKNLGFESTAIMDMTENELYAAFYLPPSQQTNIVQDKIMNKEEATKLNRTAKINQVKYIRKKHEKEKKISSCCCCLS